jgi:hypothetical protein
MIPSDHFVRYYNEVFKFFEEQGEKHLRNYWLEISRHQELHCMELFKTKGLQGMVEYWTHIKEEENCDMSIKEMAGHVELEMRKCPSLSKVLDNDATPMERYCDHCAGWCVPLIKKAGFYPVYDIISRKEPRCKLLVFKNKEDAEQAEKKAILLAE